MEENGRFRLDYCFFFSFYIYNQIAFTVLPLNCISLSRENFAIILRICTLYVYAKTKLSFFIIPPIHVSLLDTGFIWEWDGWVHSFHAGLVRFRILTHKIEVITGMSRFLHDIFFSSKAPDFQMYTTNRSNHSQSSIDTKQIKLNFEA